MTQELILIRGLPGSGKSTLAKKFIKKDPNMLHYEADMYFVRSLGYKFNPIDLQKAHLWCRDTTRCALGAGRSVVVSNTFVKKWEMEPYIKMAEELRIPVRILEAKGNFQNIHGVPEETIQKMRRNWEEL